jgi:mono/diheme cytochrome c family protein
MPVPRLRERIRDGLEGTSMPAWRHVLNDAEVDAVAAYVSQVLFHGTAAVASR